MLDSADSSATFEHTRSLERNVWKFYLLKCAWGMRWGTLLPIFALYFQDRGMSLTGFMILMASLNLFQRGGGIAHRPLCRPLQPQVEHFLGGAAWLRGCARAHIRR